MRAPVTRIVTSDALDSVPETMLWNLHHRAAEARRPDTVLADPIGVELADRLAPRLERRFGVAHPLLAQAQALRALRFDQEVLRFVEFNPDGTVVALGEGLETQFWRVDNGRVQWLSVDLEEGVEARAASLPSSERLRSAAGSALDERWIDEVDQTRGVLITAQGLLMYFQPDQARGLVAGCARRLPGAWMVFDVVEPWFSQRTVSGLRNTAGYRAPPMPWGVDARECVRLADLPAVASLERLRFPRGRGPFFGVAAPIARGASAAAASVSDPVDDSADLVRQMSLYAR